MLIVLCYLETICGSAEIAVEPISRTHKQNAIFKSLHQNCQIDMD